jgi:hypothetical protein
LPLLSATTERAFGITGLLAVMVTPALLFPLMPPTCCAMTGAAHKALARIVLVMRLMPKRRSGAVESCGDVIVFIAKSRIIIVCTADLLFTLSCCQISPTAKALPLPPPDLRRPIKAKFYSRP